MEDHEMNFEEAYGSPPENEGTCEPLFINEEDEDYFEDCLEEIEATLTLPVEPMNYSPKCREVLQAEFNGLMQQMLAQLDVFEATHKTTSTSMDVFSEPENKTDRNAYIKAIVFKEPFIPEEMKTMFQVKNDDLGGHVETAQELSTSMDIKELGAAFEVCIDEVGQLERRRDELVRELLDLEEPMAQELQTLKKTLGKEQGFLSKVKLEKHRLQEETLMTKRRLFIVARECAQKQVELIVQHNEVEHLNKAQEELKALVAKMTEEITKLNSDHQNHVQALQQQQNKITRESTRKKTHSYVTQGRRASLDLQQYLHGGIKILEEFYEPRLMSLLKRRQATIEAISKAKEQCQELRTRLGPLREEEHMLKLQKTCLEERIQLMENQRRENVEQYRETVDLLEENSRQLKTELQIQIRKTEELEMMKNDIARELLFYRESIEGLCKKENTVMVEKT
nr:syncoilin [Misgurnus anguillicaudatus]XP_055076357.1 syncoilin [Misgurnus anguillicaudatus]